MEDTPIIQVQNISKTYPGKIPFTALQDVSLDFQKRTFYAIMGPSGSGKSTLLNCSAGLDKVTEGNILVKDQKFSDLKEPKMTKERRKNFGFVFQSYNLIESLNVLDNIVVTQKLIGVKPNKKFIKEILNQVGLKNKAKSYPSQLSGGQKQRVAIARTLSNRSTEVIFADEPTGALDQKTGNNVLELLRDSVDTYSKTVIMVTHDPVAASWADRVIFIVDGRISQQLTRPTATEVATLMTQLEASAHA